uniref:Uncharacterized protein n=1 Tax=Globodera rostochiensis TaxID=31243 RepID=A0A914GX92_GLORO
MEKNNDERLVCKMQRELERMEAANRELERRLFVETPRAQADIDQLRRDLSAERRIGADLRRELALAVGRSARLAQLLERTTNVHRAQMADYEAKLAELREQNVRLNGLLVDKTKSRSIGPTAVRLSAHSFQPPRRPPHIQRRNQSGDRSMHFGTLSTDNLQWTSGESLQGKDKRQLPLGIDGDGPSAERRRKDCATHRQKLLQQHTTKSEANIVV